MKVFLTAFGLHNPFAGPRLQAHGPIPIATEAQGGLDLDYSAILIAQSFIIDRTAYEYVLDRRGQFLGPMSHSLEVLESEGLLEVADFGEPLRKYEPEIIGKTRQTLETIEPWLSIGRKQWAQVKPEFEEFSRLHSLPGELSYDASHYGVISHLERQFGEVPPGESTRLHSILESNRRRLSTREQEEMREVLQPLVAQVLMNDLLRRSLSAPFLDWDDAQAFHDRLHLTQWSAFDDPEAVSAQIANQSRCLFQTVLPELLPERIEDVVKFIKNRGAVTSLRQELWDSLRNGEKISESWMLKLNQEVISAHLRSESRGRIIKWIGRAANLILPAVGTVGEIIVEATEAGAEGLSHRTAHKRFQWYYVLQKIKMKSRR